MVRFTQTLNHLTETDFAGTIKAELERLGREQLPLQAGLAHSSYVSDAPITAVILRHEVLDALIQVKAGIFYSGIITGCSCADDPSPVDEVNEYCEIQLLIDRQTAEASIKLI